MRPRGTRSSPRMILFEIFGALADAAFLALFFAVLLRAAAFWALKEHLSFGYAYATAFFVVAVAIVRFRLQTSYRLAALIWLIMIALVAGIVLMCAGIIHVGVAYWQSR